MTALTTTTAPKKPRSWKRRLIFLGIFLVLLPVILLGIAQAIIAAVLNPEWLVLKIEKSRNCRAEVSACSANLFGFPAYVEVRGLKLIPRDKAANQGNALTARSKVQLTHTGIAADLARVEVNVWALLAGRLSLGDIRLQDVDIRGVVRDDQDTLKDLLASAPSTEPLPPPDPTAPEAPKVERKFRAKDLPMPITLGSVVIERGRFSQSNRRKKRDLVVEDFTLNIGPAEINPKKLTQGNRIALTLSGKMASTDGKVDPPNRQADLKIAVQADIQPFDPATGDAGGRTEANIVVQKDSALNKLPSLVKLASRMARLRDRAGLDLTKLPSSGTLMQDAPLHLVYENGLTTFRGDTSFTFDTWNLVIRDGSWIAGGEQGHNFTGVIQPTKTDTDRALSDLDRFLRPKAPATADKAQSIVSARLVDKDSGRLSLPFTSTGDIGKPEVKVADAVEKVFYDLLIEVGTSGDEMDEILSLIQKKGKSKEDDEDKEPEKEKKKEKAKDKEPAADPAAEQPTPAPAAPAPVPSDPK